MRRRRRRTRPRRPTKPADIHVIAIADLDVISEQFFELRRRRVENLEFDNVTFVLNCVDVLAGDDAFVNLRKRRLRHRTLDAAGGADEAVHRATPGRDRRPPRRPPRSSSTSAQKRLDQQVEAVRARTDVDERTKEIMLANLQEVANRRLDVEKANIEDQKQKKIQESKADMEQQVRQIQNRVRSLAIAIPPLPALALGLFVFGARLRRENQGANPNRIARK